MNAANDSVRVIGIGRVRDDPKALELNFTGKPSDDDMRRIHDLLRDGPPSNDDASIIAILRARIPDPAICQTCRAAPIAGHSFCPDCKDEWTP